MPSPAISFDLDGVIMRGPFVSAVRPRVWSHLLGTPGVAHLVAEEREHHVTEAVLAEHERLLAAGELVAAWNWQAIYSEVSRGLGGQPLPDLAATVRECCQLQDAIALLPGARAGLERIAGAGLRIVAITNGYYAYQWPVLEALGVATLFEAVLSPDNVGYAKPDPRIFAAVPGVVAHIGDILLHDVLGANLAGLTSVWVRPELPEAFRHLSPEQRRHAPGFVDYLAETLEHSHYRAYHPEGTLETCMPALVALDADEAAAALLRRWPTSSMAA